MKKILIVGVILLLGAQVAFAAPPTSSNSDDGNSDVYNNSTIPDNSSVQWSVSHGTLTGGFTSGFVASQEHGDGIGPSHYYVGANNSVYAYNKSGGLEWKTEVGSVSTGVAYADGLVIVPAGGEVAALNATTGEQVWNNSLSGGVNDITVAKNSTGDVVIVATYTHTRIGAYSASGAELWTYDIGSSGGMAHHPEIHNGTVYVQGYDGTSSALRELDLSTGTLTNGPDLGIPSSYTTMSVENNTAFFVGGNDGASIYAFNASNFSAGAKWSVTTGLPEPAKDYTALTTSKYIFFTGVDGTTYVYDHAGTQVNTITEFTAEAAKGDTVYGFRNNSSSPDHRKALAINATSGNVIREVNETGKTLVIGHGSIYVSNDSETSRYGIGVFQTTSSSDNTTNNTTATATATATATDIKGGGGGGGGGLGSTTMIVGALVGLVVLGGLGWYFFGRSGQKKYVN